MGRNVSITFKDIAYAIDFVEHYNSLKTANDSQEFEDHAQAIAAILADSAVKATLVPETFWW